MSIAVYAATVEIGEQQQLEIAQGEDREYRLTFNDSAGTARDLTGATAIVMTVRSRSGLLIFARSYSGFQGAATAGTPRFQVLQADTANLAVQPYDVDVTWTDASGYQEQLLVASTFLVLLGVHEQDDALTTPPAIPVVYGLTWLSEWTGKSGGYNLNDGVYAYDGSLGATAISTFRATVQGVTHHPITGSSQVVATAWAYIGQHGGAGAQGIQGATGPQGATGANGVQGETGPTGPAGEAGPTGPAGVTGFAGNTAGSSGIRMTYLGGADLQTVSVSGGSGNAGYTALAGDYYIFVTSTGASFGVWLPADAVPGAAHVIQDSAGGAGVSYPILLKAATGYINGSSTGIAINSPHGLRGVVCQSTGWWLAS